MHHRKLFVWCCRCQANLPEVEVADGVHTTCTGCGSQLVVRYDRECATFRTKLRSSEETLENPRRRKLSVLGLWCCACFHDLPTDPEPHDGQEIDCPNCKAPLVIRKLPPHRQSGPRHQFGSEPASRG